MSLCCSGETGPCPRCAGAVGMHVQTDVRSAAPHAPQALQASQLLYDAAVRVMLFRSIDQYNRGIRDGLIMAISIVDERPLLVVAEEVDKLAAAGKA